MKTGHWTDNSCLLQLSLQLKKSRFRNQSLYFKGPLFFRWDTPATHTYIQGFKEVGQDWELSKPASRDIVPSASLALPIPPPNNVTLRGPGIQMPESVGDIFYLNHHGYLPAIRLPQS